MKQKAGITLQSLYQVNPAIESISSSLSDLKAFSKLHMAVLKNNQKEVTTLISKKKNLSLITQFNDQLDQTPLLTAIQLHERNIAIQLIRCSVDAHLNLEYADKAQNTPLHVACFHYDDAIVTALLRASGKSVNALNLDGNTPLHYLAERVTSSSRTWKENISLFAQKGANFNIRNKNGLTVLHKCCFNRRMGWALAKECINHGSSVTLCDAVGATALHYAVQRRQYRLVDLLTLEGADVDAADADGATPRSLVKMSRDRRMYEYIERIKDISDFLTSVGEDINKKYLKTFVHETLFLDVLQLITPLTLRGIGVDEESAKRILAHSRDYTLNFESNGIADKTLDELEKEGLIIDPKDVEMIFTEKNKIGSGTSSKVYLCHYRGEVAAVKVLHRDSSAEDRRDLTREALMLSRFHNNAIMRVFGVVVTPIFGIIMETCGKGNFMNMLQTHRFTFGEVLHHFSHILSALNYLHTLNPAIVHRDVKSLNVLMKDNSCHLADFGLCATAGSATDGRCTVQYAPPEHFTSSSHHAAATQDIYAAGIVLFECCTNVFKSYKAPWENYADFEIISAVKKGKRPKLPTRTPPEAQKLYSMMISGKVEKRTTAAQAIEMVESICKSLGQSSVDDIKDAESASKVAEHSDKNKSTEQIQERRDFSDNGKAKHDDYEPNDQEDGKEDEFKRNQENQSTKEDASSDAQKVKETKRNKEKKHTQKEQTKKTPEIEAPTSSQDETT